MAMSDATCNTHFQSANIFFDLLLTVAKISQTRYEFPKYISVSHTR